VSDQNPLTIPSKPEPRTSWIGFRVSDSERKAVEALAQRLGVTSSYMVRHFLLQAVNHFEQASNVNVSGKHLTD
jgi:hypothetical protein